MVHNSEIFWEHRVPKWKRKIFERCDALLPAFEISAGTVVHTVGIDASTSSSLFPHFEILWKKDNLKNRGSSSPFFRRAFKIYKTCKKDSSLPWARARNFNSFYICVCAYTASVSDKKDYHILKHYFRTGYHFYFKQRWQRLDLKISQIVASAVSITILQILKDPKSC